MMIDRFCSNNLSIIMAVNSDPEVKGSRLKRNSQLCWQNPTVAGSCRTSVTASVFKSSPTRTGLGFRGELWSFINGSYSNMKEPPGPVSGAAVTGSVGSEHTGTEVQTLSVE